MADEKKNWLGPYIPEGNWIREIWQQARLAYHLLTDPRVPIFAKLIPIGALAYVLLPFDIAPDMLPVIGQLDDLAILMMGLRLFFEIAPQEVVHEHLRRIGQAVGSWRVVDNPPPPPKPDSAGDVVEGQYEVKD